MKRKPRGWPVVGSFFHEHANGAIERQGRVLSKELRGHYFVEWFSFLDGYATKRELVPFDRMIGWTFYPSEELMRKAWELEDRRRQK